MIRNQIQKSRRGFKLSIGMPIMAVAMCAWYVSIFVFHSSSTESASRVVTTVPILTMAHMFNSLNPGMLSSFVLMWEVGMTAMMFPALVPVMSVYQRVMAVGKQSASSRLAKSSLFIVGYLLTYGVEGFLVFFIVYGTFQFGSILNSSSYSVIGLAAVLFGTGLWQLSPLKERCLAKCVSPMGFFLTHGRDGNSGAVRMGAANGLYCAGCCWMYSLVMLVVTAMSLISMVLLTGLIIVEKAFVGKTAWFKALSAGIFFSFAGIILLFPSVLF